MAEHMRAELVVDALEMALWQRRPAVGLVHHSDRSGQYVSLIFGQTARAAGIDISMGARGCALDNAVCEAFFATLKKELTRRRSWPSRRELETAVFGRSKAGTTAGGCTPRSAPARPPTTRTELSPRTVPASPLRGSHTPRS